jgi:uncharacterized protein (DUF433 family)
LNFAALAKFVPFLFLRDTRPPCIRGIRLTVRRVVEALALDPNRDGLFRSYPELEPDDVKQALEFAAANLEDSAAEGHVA